jgi:drug/metabolite transporter (DMT)-like permease
MSRSRGSTDVELGAGAAHLVRSRTSSTQSSPSSNEQLSISERESLQPLVLEQDETNRTGGNSKAGGTSSTNNNPSSSSTSIITPMGFKVLVLLAVQNSSKNLLMRFVMREKPKFLTSAAVIGSECTKLTLSILYILLVEKQSFDSIVQYFKEDWRNTVLVAVPASAYNLQMTLEYIALANLDAAMFSVLVQLKLLFTATFAAVVLRKKLKVIQVISLLLLTVGVMLCNMQPTKTTTATTPESDEVSMSSAYWKGIFATLGIAVSSGFASVYTEKVIKTQRAVSTVVGKYSLAVSIYHNTQIYRVCYRTSWFLLLYSYILQCSNIFILHSFIVQYSILKFNWQACRS